MFRSLIPALLLLVALPVVAGSPETTYGKGVTSGETVKVADLLAKPEAYVGKPLRVEGTITEVCPMRGCWIRLSGGGSDARTVQFKVPDGAIVFPATVKGRPAVVEGTLRRVELSRDEAVEHQKHLAEERGEAFDPASVTGPMTLYVIDGGGAVVR